MNETTEQVEFPVDSPAHVDEFLSAMCECEPAAGIRCNACRAQDDVDALRRDDRYAEELRAALAEVVRISDRKHDAWDAARAALAKRPAATIDAYAEQYREDAERYRWLVTNCHLHEAPENFGRHTYDKAWIDGRVDACRKRQEAGEVGVSADAEKWRQNSYGVVNGIVRGGLQLETPASRERADAPAPVEPLTGLLVRQINFIRAQAQAGGPNCLTFIAMACDTALHEVKNVPRVVNKQVSSRMPKWPDDYEHCPECRDSFSFVRPRGPDKGCPGCGYHPSKDDDAPEEGR